MIRTELAMQHRCPECGATLPDGRTCRDHFHSLLLLEWEIVGIPNGDQAHFLAVGTYAIQHSQSMNYTAGALVGLQDCIAEHLAGRLTLEQIRQRVRSNVAGAGRVLRQEGDPVVRSPLSWPINIADVLAGGTQGYLERVTAWARTTLDVLET